ncbi:MAG: hypothetical protein Q9187_002768 [Circinaria calcarea]
MIVELVPNPDVYEDVYLSESDEDSDESEDDASDSETEDEFTRDINQQMKELEDQLTKSLSYLNNAKSRLTFLESLMGKVDKPDTNSISRSLDVYRLEREKITNDQSIWTGEGKRLRETIQKLEKESARRGKSAAKEKAKVQKAKDKAKQKEWEKKERLRTERRLAKERTREERSHFWPKQVYRIVLTLESNSGMTPSSSRRGSVNSLPEVAIPSQGSKSDFARDSSDVTLCLSYITQSASWSPHYNLSISTPSTSGTIIYRAEFSNTTSETWKDAKVILSTSQTSFQGLDEPIPTMSPWHLRLNKGFGYNKGPIYSSEEMNIRRNLQKATENSYAQQRGDLFGHLPRQRAPFSKPVISERRVQRSAKPNIMSKFQLNRSSMQQPQCAGMAEEAESNSNGNRGFGRFDGDQNTVAAVNTFQGNFFGNAPAPPGALSRAATQGSSVFAKTTANAPFGFPAQNEATLVPSDASLVFQESVWEETGLTTSYDLPGLRTIPPSKTARRHKIATIELKDIQLSYICIPKLRTAAFLKAHVTNSSGVTLLKGLAGLTLDGSFLGNTHLPRCSAGQTFTLPLGVDPAINVLYSRPGVKKNISSGVFQKEDSCVYTRTITITNTKSIGGPIDLVVSDQVPISEDEKLKIDVLTPKGLKGEGDKAATGQAVEDDAVSRASTKGSVYSLDGARGVVGKDEKWGKAVATFKKAGEVEWNVKLNPGKGVRLLLEYDTRFPSTETVVGA